LLKIEGWHQGSIAGFAGFFVRIFAQSTPW